MLVLVGEMDVCSGQKTQRGREGEVQKETEKEIEYENQFFF